MLERTLINDDMNQEPDIENPRQNQLTTLPEEILKQVMSHSEEDILKWIAVNKQCFNTGVNNFTSSILKNEAQEHYINYRKHEHTERDSFFSGKYSKMRAKIFCTSFLEVGISLIIAANVIAYIIITYGKDEPIPNLAFKLSAYGLICAFLNALRHAIIAPIFKVSKNLENRQREVRNYIDQVNKGNINLIDKRLDKLMLFHSQNPAALKANTLSPAADNKNDEKPKFKQP